MDKVKSVGSEDDLKEKGQTLKGQGKGVSRVSRVKVKVKREVIREKEKEKKEVERGGGIKAPVTGVVLWVTNQMNVMRIFME